MSGIYDYLDKYGNKTFDEVDYTEIDNIIFTQISYLDFKDIIYNNETKIRLLVVADTFIKNKKNHINNKRLNMLRTIKNMSRYKNLLLSNYVYKLTTDEQFGALTIDINDNLRCVVFEGTDETIVGWKEDFAISYLPLIPAGYDAIKYLNKVSKNAKKIIVTGHSKGGYLAIISAMYSNLLTKSKLEYIYSLDGPGIKITELKSLKFNSIRNKYIKIIPKCSIIGTLFYNPKSEVCDSKAFGISAHSVFTWIINDTKFKRDNLTKFSSDLDNNLTTWIESYSKDEIKYFCNYIFNIFDKLNIKTIYDLKNIDRSVYIGIILNIKNTEPKFIQMLVELLNIVRLYHKKDIGKYTSFMFDIYNKLVH